MEAAIRWRRGAAGLREDEVLWTRSPVSSIRQQNVRQKKFVRQKLYDRFSKKRKED